MKKSKKELNSDIEGLQDDIRTHKENIQKLEKAIEDYKVAKASAENELKRHENKLKEMEAAFLLVKKADSL